MTEEFGQDVLGGCYCGEVRFRIVAGAQPKWAGYCHCQDCRHAHAAPLYQAAYVDARAFQITQGEHRLSWYTRSQAQAGELNFKRYFCQRCGTRVYNTTRTEHDGATVDECGTFPSLFDDQLVATNATWSPRDHVQCAESIMKLSALKDDLPKYDRWWD